MYSGGTLTGKKGVMSAEKGHFTCKVYEKVGARTPCVPLVPTPITTCFHFIWWHHVFTGYEVSHRHTKINCDPAEDCNHYIP